MKSHNKRYGRALKRLLHELRWAISNRNAYNALVKASPRTSWGFFSYSAVALKNDMYSHAIKVLDQHKDAASFRYIKNCNSKCVKSEIEKVNLSLKEIEDLSTKLNHVRDKTHFHIDKNKVFSPESVWKEANIEGAHFNKVFDGLWLALKALHIAHFNCAFNQPLYTGDEIKSIIAVCKEGQIPV